MRVEKLPSIRCRPSFSIICEVNFADSSGELPSSSARSSTGMRRPPMRRPPASLARAKARSYPSLNCLPLFASCPVSGTVAPMTILSAADAAEAAKMLTSTAKQRGDIGMLLKPKGGNRSKVVLIDSHDPAALGHGARKESTCQLRYRRQPTLASPTRSRACVPALRMAGHTSAQLRPPRVCNRLLRRVQPLESAEVGADRLREHHGPVRLLAVLQDRDHRPAYRKSGAVERIHEAGLFLRRGAEPDLRPARLIVRERRARADLAIRILPRAPDFEVVGLLRGEAEVGRAQRHHPVMQPELLQRLLRVAHQLFQTGMRVLGLFEADELHLVELVLPDDPLRVLAVAARLAPEARGERAVLDGQVPGEHLVAVVVRHRNFRGGNEIQTRGRLEEILLELGQLTRAAHRLRVHQIRRKQLDVSLLAVQVDEEGDQRALETRQLGPVEDEPRPGNLAGAGEVEKTQSLSELVVLLGCEGHAGLLAPLPNHLVVRRLAADRNRLVGQVRDVEERLLDFLLDLLEPRLLRLHLVGKRLEARAQLGLLLALQ